MKIQKPSIGRVVHFTAFRGHEQKASDVYAAIVVGVGRFGSNAGCVDLVTFGTNSTYFQHDVPHSAEGNANTWRYPPFVKDEIEVES